MEGVIHISRFQKVDVMAVESRLFIIYTLIYGVYIVNVAVISHQSVSIFRFVKFSLKNGL